MGQSKVVSKIIELMMFPVIQKFAKENGYEMIFSAEQNHYPDVTFITKDKQKIKAQRDTLRTMSERIQLALVSSTGLDTKTFSQLLNFELNNQDSTKGDIISPARIPEIFTYAVDINKLNVIEILYHYLSDIPSSY